MLPGSTFLLEKVDKSSTGIARHIDKFVHSAALPDRMEDRLVYKIQTKKPLHIRIHHLQKFTTYHSMAENTVTNQMVEALVA